MAEFVHLTVFKNNRAASAVVHTGFLVRVVKGAVEEHYRADFGADPNAPENQSSSTSLFSVSSSSLPSSLTSTACLPSGSSGRVVVLIENIVEFQKTVEESVEIGFIELSSEKFFNFLQTVANLSEYNVMSNNCRHYCVKIITDLCKNKLCDSEGSAAALNFLERIQSNDGKIVAGIGIAAAGFFALAATAAMMFANTGSTQKKRDSSSKR